MNASAREALTMSDLDRHFQAIWNRACNGPSLAALAPEQTMGYRARPRRDKRGGARGGQFRNDSGRRARRRGRQGMLPENWGDR